MTVELSRFACCMRGALPRGCRGYVSDRDTTTPLGGGGGGASEPVLDSIVTSFERLEEPLRLTALTPARIVEEAAVRLAAQPHDRLHGTRARRTSRRCNGLADISPDPTPGHRSAAALSERITKAMPRNRPPRRSSYPTEARRGDPSENMRRSAEQTMRQQAYSKGEDIDAS
ncbi:hypothetical protein GQR58_029676 [Nymphon striatum]|nr:hypothetical protein GQR58_029676 [Nymphon striatum]